MRDEDIQWAFRQFTAAAGPMVRPAGTRAVRERVAHRRRVHTVAACFVGALLLATLPAVALSGHWTSFSPPAESVTTMDGTAYYFVAEQTGVVVYSVSNGSVTEHYRIGATPGDLCPANSVMVSPDGQWLAWVADNDPDHSGDAVGTLTVSRLDGSDARTLDHVRCDIGREDWSADSRRLAVTGSEGPMYLDIDSWATEPGGTPGAVWSANGSFRAQADPGAGGFSVERADGTRVATVPEYSNDSSGFEVCGFTIKGVSDDGRYVAIGGCGASASRNLPTLYLYDTGAGRHAQLPVATTDDVILLGGGRALVRGPVDGTRASLVLVSLSGERPQVLSSEVEPEALPANATLLRYAASSLPPDVQPVTASPTPSVAGDQSTDGQISIEELTVGPVPLPEWNSDDLTVDFPADYLSTLETYCPSGSVRLISYDPDQAMNGNVVAQLAYANLDADPEVETAVLVNCFGYSEAVVSRVIVFDRTADGHIVNLGQIVSGFVWSIAPNPSGGVDVDLSDRQACCGIPKVKEYHQTRTYEFEGPGFAQTAGPTSFTTHAEQIDLRLELSEVKWGPIETSADYWWRTRDATVTLTVTNAGSVASNPFIILADLLHEPNASFSPLAAGESRTITVVVHVGVELEQPVRLDLTELGPVGDADATNNSVTFDSVPG